MKYLNLYEFSQHFRNHIISGATASSRRNIMDSYHLHCKHKKPIQDWKNIIYIFSYPLPLVLERQLTENKGSRSLLQENAKVFTGVNHRRAIHAYNTNTFVNTEVHCIYQQHKDVSAAALFSNYCFTNERLSTYYPTVSLGYLRQHHLPAICKNSFFMESQGEGLPQMSVLPNPLHHTSFPKGLALAVVLYAAASKSARVKDLTDEKTVFTSFHQPKEHCPKGFYHRNVTNTVTVFLSRKQQTPWSSIELSRSQGHEILSVKA